MATTLEWAGLGTTQTVITGSALNNMATYVLGSAFVWTQATGGILGYVYGRVQMTFKFQSSPTTNTGFSLWFIKSQDAGATYEDSAAAPPRPPDVTLLGHAYGGTGDTAAHTVSKDILIPPGTWKALLLNNATGQSLTANNTDNILTVTPLSIQNV
jgi:hypothetical protein